MQYKKDAQEGDSKRASRGNWWEGIIVFLSKVTDLFN